MRTYAEGVAVVAAQELRAAVRGRMVLAFGALFTLLAAGIALAGLGASGQLLVQGFTRTAVSLLTLSLYLFPLIGVLLGATAFGGEDGGTELLLAQPIGRGAVLLGRTLGLAAALVAIALGGFGATAVLVGAQAGAAGAGGYLLVAGAATAVGLAWLGVGVAIGVAARRLGTAAGWALAAWFGAAVLYDLACIAALQLVGGGDPSGGLVALLALNPIDGLRALALLALGADVLLGPTGAALQRLLGEGGGAAWVAASLALWLAGPLLLAHRLYGRRDF